MKQLKVIKARLGDNALQSEQNDEFIIHYEVFKVHYIRKIENG